MRPTAPFRDAVCPSLSLPTSDKVAIGLQWRPCAKCSSADKGNFLCEVSRFYGAQGRDRTTDTAIFSHVYHFC
jgi:hypothetical protein